MTHQPRHARRQILPRQDPRLRHRLPLSSACTRCRGRDRRAASQGCYVTGYQWTLILGCITSNSCAPPWLASYGDFQAGLTRTSRDRLWGSTCLVAREGNPMASWHLVRQGAGVTAAATFPPRQYGLHLAACVVLALMGAIYASRRPLHINRNSTRRRDDALSIRRLQDITDYSVYAWRCPRCASGRHQMLHDTVEVDRRRSWALISKSCRHGFVIRRRAQLARRSISAWKQGCRIYNRDAI